MHHSALMNHHNGIMIYNHRKQRYYDLDALAALVWGLIQQPRTLTEIRDAIVDHFGLDTESAERDLLTLLEQMEKEGLVQADDTL